jgi:hypothetical protein
MRLIEILTTRRSGALTFISTARAMAIPVPARRFSDAGDSWLLLLEFLQFVNVTVPPEIRHRISSRKHNLRVNDSRDPRRDADLTQPSRVAPIAAVD